MTKKSYMKTGYRQPQSRMQPQFASGNKQQGQAYQDSVRRQQNSHSVDRHANLINAGIAQPRNRMDAGSVGTQPHSRMDAEQAQKAEPDAVNSQKEVLETLDAGTAQEGTEAAKEPQAAPEEIIQQQHEFEQWRTQETERLEHKEQKLHKQKKQIEQERMQLDIEKRSFLHQQEFEVTRQRNEEQLLDMKRKILEDELYKLAEERKMFEQKKSFYDKVDSYQAENALKKPASVHGAIFFAGVNGLGALKKRYKDLLKIYHPDNKCGDTDTIQEINKEYQRLLEKMKGRDANGK